MSSRRRSVASARASELPPAPRSTWRCELAAETARLVNSLVAHPALQREGAAQCRAQSAAAVAACHVAHVFAELLRMCIDRTLSDAHCRVLARHMLEAASRDGTLKITFCPYANANGAVQKNALDQIRRATEGALSSVMARLSAPLSPE